MSIGNWKSFKWIAFAAILGVGLGLFLSQNAWREYRKQKSHLAEIKAETREVQEDRAELMSRAAQLDSPAGMEEEARERGFRKENETPIELESAPDHR